jgi:chromosome segregation ATPase
LGGGALGAWLQSRAQIKAAKVAADGAARAAESTAQTKLEETVFSASIALITGQLERAQREIDALRLAHESCHRENSELRNEVTALRLENAGLKAEIADMRATIAALTPPQSE